MYGVRPTEGKRGEKQMAAEDAEPAKARPDEDDRPDRRGQIIRCAPSREPFTQDGWTGVVPEAARRLLLAAVEAFAERGFHATTTRDIAGRAGMSPAALYIHYKTKEELLFQISRIGHERSLSLLREAAGTPGSAADRLAAAVSVFVRWHAERHTTARVVQYELSALAPDHYAHIVEMRRCTESVMRGLLEDGVEQGEFSVADVRGTAQAVLSLCIDVARWFSPTGRRTPEEVGSFYADLSLRMVRAD